MNFYKVLMDSGAHHYIKKVIDDGKCYLVSMTKSDYYRILYNVPNDRHTGMEVNRKNNGKIFIVLLINKDGKIKTLQASAYENDYLKYTEVNSFV
jgi:hypothetical protein